MSAGDILRQEAGKEGSRMPAWKRELLERRKAKGGGSGPGVDSVSSRVNGELTGSGKDEVTGAHSNRTYTITPAGKRSAAAAASPEKTKEPSDRAAEKTITDNGVLQESLGPIKENPFIKLEKERKKRRERDTTSRPLQHILEMYSSVPGIRTIRAENIIIIESDPDYFRASGTQQNGTVSGYSSLSDLLERTGSPVTEIHAKEVVIYDTALSKSEENLSTLGRASSELSDLAQAQGTVSRMLQKFDRKYGKLHGKSRSSENLLDLDTSPVLSRPRARFYHPDVVPKCAPCPQPGSPVRIPASYSQSVFQSSERKHHESPNSSEDSSPVPGSPQSVSSFRRRFEVVGGRRDEIERGQSKPVRERDWDSTDEVSKAKVPCSPESHCARAESLASATLPLISTRFEIRPSPRPDLSTLPASDVQARALANLRLQSRNSFTVIPKRHGVPSAPGNTAPSSPVLSPAYPHAEEPSVPTPSPASPSPEKIPIPPVPDKTDLIHPEKPSSPTIILSPPAADSLTKSTTPLIHEPALEKLPITNIDDLVVESSPPFPSPMVQRRKGNTFTVVPKRRTEPQPSTPPAPEPTQEPATVPQGSPSSAEAPYAHLGTLLKKRYPAVEEIEVIGGYLSLGRSCLSKTGSTGKKLKISFNESSLQSTFEYPSESSVWDSGEEEEGGGIERGGGGEEEGGISIERIHIPRPSYTSSPTTHSPNSTDLSSYTPKHSVDFTSWQEKKLGDSTDSGDANSRPATDMSDEVMLTPADSSSLSDFSSEPALYF
ncbi:taperin isoform X2 [Neoarius graeffei]|uniref:taperin isoform X2 n=1 Tax=Neoarius graeffei TaxID=443677 RepID=UPI00298BF9C0|nr:taperin isoform X2 [Neoarius graeffei]